LTAVNFSGGVVSTWPPTSAVSAGITNSPGWVGVRMMFFKKLAEYWPLTMLIFREVPASDICRCGMSDGNGMDLGLPPSKRSVRVALSPTVTFSRSSVAVKLAAPASNGASHASPASNATPRPSSCRLRRREFDLIHDDNLRISSSA